MTIIKNNFKLLILHNLIAFLLLIIVPAVFSIRNLKQGEVIYITERFISLIGIVLLTPITLAEDNKCIRELLLSKKVSLNFIWFQRIINQLLILSVLTTISIFVFQWNHCELSISRVFYVTFANGVFLGGLGIFSYTITNQWIVGYAIPLCYYLMNLVFKDKKFMKALSLFSKEGAGSGRKHLILLIGMSLIVFSLLFLEKTKRTRLV